jgi:hypothetical protein
MISTLDRSIVDPIILHHFVPKMSGNKVKYRFRFLFYFRGEKNFFVNMTEERENTVTVHVLFFQQIFYTNEDLIV